MIPEDLVYWLALQDKRWITPADVLERAFRELGSLEKLWNADHSYLSQLGFSDFYISKFANYSRDVNLEDYERKLGKLQNDNVKVIRYVDSEYPRRLKSLVGLSEGPPLVLFHKGSLVDFRNTVAVVGTREASHYGHMMARRLSRAIAKRGFTIVSGLARGIDTEAHCGALEARGGRTVAVLAWMNPVYPPENVKLAEDIMRKGAMVSERYFGRPRNFKRFSRGSFVERNRITSGISRCIVAVESTAEGGTVHQVRMAISQGRKVFTVRPPSHKNKARKGFKLFVKMGAEAISTTKSVLDFLKKPENNALQIDKPLETY